MRSFLTVLALGVGLCGLGGTAVADNQVFVVDSTADDASRTACDATTPDDCSLRGAILAANAAAGADTVQVPAGTYTLTIPGVGEDGGAFGDLDITGDLVLAGAGAATTIIQACAVDQKTDPCPAGQGIADDRVLHVDPAAAGLTVRIAGVTLQHGGPDQVPFVAANGGGLLLGPHAGFASGVGTLTLFAAVVRANQTPQSGGGLLNNGGTLVVTDSTVSDNRAAGDGGGIANQGALAVSHSTIRDNTTINPFSGSGGGGIVSYGGVASVTASTISGNGKPPGTTGFPAVGCGGGIRADAGELRVTNSTISGNRGGDTGGGLCVAGAANVSIRNSTITGNTTQLPAAGQGGGGIYGSLAVTLSNTIVAGNTSANSIGHDCRGALASGGHNLIGDAIPFPNTPPWCTLGTTTGDQVGTSIPIDARLGPLADNGGPTRTHALLPDSPAIDAGSPAEPGRGGFACEPVDQRGAFRPQDGNSDGTNHCDIGAFEGADPAGGFSVSGVRPNRAGNTGSVLALVYGRGFVGGLSVELRRAGELSITGNPVAIRDAGAVAATTFDLAGRATGAWDLVVTHPDGASRTLVEAFVIEATRAPDLWVDLVAPSAIRAGRPVRLFLLYGNRGNVDALGVPLVIGTPRTVDFRPRSPITPPPPLPGPRAVDWNRVPANMGDPTLPGLRATSLFLPVVPAGFVGMVDFTLIAPPSSIGTAIDMPFAIGDPYFGPPLDPQMASRLVQGVRSYSRRILETGIPAEFKPQIQSTMATQLLTAAQEGAAALLNGEPPRAYAVPHFVINAAISAAAAPGVEVCTDGLDNDRDGNVDGDDPDCADDDDDGDDDDDDDPPECEPEEADDPWYEDSRCRGEPDCLEGGFNTCAPPRCQKWPPTACGGPPPGGPRTIGPHDPNEKVGSLGAGDQHYVTGGDPLRYLVLFENLETASAAAQDVVITDQLDVAAADLDTFSLGPIAFGDTTVVPSPGLSAFTTDVDLRPAQNLLVRVVAGLDGDTGLVTWRFTSLDPVTRQPPEDPLAGFLPPNVSPPEGEGSVAFTIRPRAGLPTGTAICNEASIVFDVNPAILTPAWCNTLDNGSPSSQVTQPAAPVQTSASFSVQWSGSDAGSGVRDYSVFVRQDDGPFIPLVSLTPETAATFTGQPGSTYAFYSVARDLTFNAEEAPATPDVVTTIDLCPNDPDKAAPGECGCGVADADRDGDGAVDCVTASLAFGALRPRNGGRASFRANGFSGQPRGRLRYHNGTTTFVAAQLTAFVADGRTARIAGVGTDGRPFLAWATDGRPDVFRLWIDGVEQTGDGSLARGNLVVHP
jgi:hypothetical protein